MSVSSLNYHTKFNGNKKKTPERVNSNFPLYQTPNPAIVQRNDN